MSTVLGKNFNSKFTAKGRRLSDRVFHVTIAGADIGILKSLHTLLSV